MQHIFRSLAHHKGMFFYLLLMMSVMLCLSHGTQDLYPDFLKSIPGITAQTIFGMKTLYGIPILYNIGAIVGASFAYGASSSCNFTCIFVGSDVSDVSSSASDLKCSTFCALDALPF